MKRPANFRILIVLCSLYLFASQNSWAVEDTIIAVVNNDIITQRDLADYLESIHFQLQSEGKSESQINKIMEELKNDSVQNLIDDHIMINEADKVGLEIRKELIDQKLTNIQEKYASEKDFLDALLAQGSTISDLRKKISNQLKIKYLVEEMVKSKIFVNPQEVTDYYKSNFEHYQKPERFDLDSIYIRFTKSTDAAKAKANEAAALLNQGKDFAEVAKQYSESPSIGVLAKGEMLPAIEEAVMNLKEGTVSKPIAVANGIYIFKLKAKLPPETSSLEEVKNKIYDFLFQKKYKTGYFAWLNKLKKSAYIDIKQQ